MCPCVCLSLCVPLAVSASHNLCISLCVPLTVSASHNLCLALCVPLTVCASRCVCISQSVPVTAPLTIFAPHCICVWFSLCPCLPLTMAAFHYVWFSLRLPLTIFACHCVSVPQPPGIRVLKPADAAASDSPHTAETSTQKQAVHQLSEDPYTSTRDGDGANKLSSAVEAELQHLGMQEFLADMPTNPEVVLNACCSCSLSPLSLLLTPAPPQCLLLLLIVSSHSLSAAYSCSSLMLVALAHCLLSIWCLCSCFTKDERRPQHVPSSAA